MNQQFIKEEIQMANKYMKRCLTSIASRGTEIIMTKRYQKTLIISAKIKKKKKVIKTKCWQQCGETGLSYIAGGNVQYCSDSGKEFGSCLRN